MGKKLCEPYLLYTASSVILKATGGKLILTASNENLNDFILSPESISDSVY